LSLPSGHCERSVAISFPLHEIASALTCLAMTWAVIVVTFLLVIAVSRSSEHGEGEAWQSEVEASGDLCG
jgi:hypothetical protein